LENCALSLLAFSALVMESLITRATTTTNRFPGLAYPQTAFPGGELIQVENAQKFIVQKKFSFKRSGTNGRTDGRTDGTTDGMQT